ncbi:hypothetical protein Bca4012_084636 [Brassica carinata]
MAAVNGYQGNTPAETTPAATGSKQPAPTTKTVDSQSMGGDPGISAFPEEDNIFCWKGTITGSKETVFEGTEYRLSLAFSNDYPFKPPKVKFETCCFHPNVDLYGNICLDILQLEMEALYAKLYDKYTALKTRKFSELNEVSREQEEKFLNCVRASETLIEHLRSENQDLKVTLDTLRDEITEIRHALSEQVKELISEGVPHNYKDHSGTKRKTPESPQVTTRSMRKRMGQSEDNMVETDTVSPTRRLRIHSSEQTEDMVETDVASPHIQKSTTETLLVPQPQCCKTTDVGSSKSAGCPFQALGEHLIGMKLSTSDEGGRACIVASHPSSGLSFTLTWLNSSTGEEDELLYKVESLGTFERVVPEWMRDVIKFGTSMIPVFFQRVSRVIKPLS